MEQYLEHTVKKRKATRVSYRIVGLIFMIVGVLLLVWGLLGGGLRIVRAAIGLGAVFYGFTLVKASFRTSAFDSTYVFEEEQIRIRQAKKDVLVPYFEVTNVNLVIPDPDMPYYLLKLDSKRGSFVLPFMGNRDKCDAIYKWMLKRVGIYEEEDTGNSES